ncbi:FAD-dependent monooxygenase [Shouchella clausii]|uniref:FAD-dependent monooxygenase n=1 Tax=Shouchella clausii TaxID=79880 RepID=UPI003983811F
MNTFNKSVIIVGGGPVGLALSLVLSKYKIPSLILETREAPTSKDESRAITWMPRGLEFLEWLGMSKQFHEKGVLRVLHQFENNKGKLLGWSFDRLETPYQYSLQLPQHDTEVILEDAARKTGMVEIRRGHKVMEVSQTKDKVGVKVQSKAGEYELFAPLGVGCDGANSVTRTKLGIHKNWKDYGMDSAVADFDMECDLPKDVSNIVLDPSRPYGFFYFAPGRWRFIYRINKGESREEATSSEFVSILLKERMPDAEVRRMLWASAFRLGQGQSQTYRKGRWILTGDAAHAMGPSAGAGMMVGMLGTWRLGWRLALAMKQHKNFSSFLDDYSKEQRVGADEIQNNNALIFRNMAITNSLLARGRSLLLRTISNISAIGQIAMEKEALLGQILPVDLSIDQIRPVGSTPLKKSGKWVMGKRAPYFLEEKDFHPIQQLSLEHTLISIGRYQPEEENKLFADIHKDIDFPVYKDLLIPKEQSNYRQESKDFIFALVRPDQHVVSIFKTKI